MKIDKFGAMSPGGDRLHPLIAKSIDISGLQATYADLLTQS